MKLNELTIVEAGKMLASGEISSVELTKACLARIADVDGQIKACITVDESKALAAAKLADERLQAGERHALLGIPYLAKDNILTKGWLTTAASAMLADYIAPYNATVIDKLEAVGAVLLGKTNLDEFAHGASTETSHFGVTHNPWNLTKVPGGSSGGSAAAVATDMCLFALGTDTGGSIRHPASFCGVVGLKPTYGLCSRWGLVSMTSSTDVPGPLTKTPVDASLVLETLAGTDNFDATTTLPVDMNYKVVTNNLQGLKVGVVAEFMNDAVSEEIKQAVRQAIKTLEAKGAEVVEINLPHALYGVSVYYIITPSEVSSNLARYDGLRYGHKTTDSNGWMADVANSRGSGFGAEVKRRIMLGTYALSAGYYDAYYLQAQKVRTLIINDFEQAFAAVDVLLCPTTAATAFGIGEQSADPLKMYLEDVFLTPASLAGIPAVSVPVGFADGLPLGLQLMANKYQEAKMLAVAQELYEQNEASQSRPQL